jgi:hypothetical protein
MSFSLHGQMAFDRPLEDLNTVLDMVGLSARQDGEKLLAGSPEIDMTFTPLGAGQVQLDGAFSAEADPEAFCRHLALALESDGINFELHLSDSSGQDVGHYRPAS